MSSKLALVLLVREFSQASIPQEKAMGGIAQLMRMRNPSAMLAPPCKLRALPPVSDTGAFRLITDLWPLGKYYPCKWMASQTARAKVPRSHN
jgi:hypothetical protein